MSQINVNNIYDGNGTDSARLYGVSMRYGGTNFVNRIINGNMVIDQRNNGAAVTANQDFPVDRWQKIGTASSSLQRSTDAPAGFTNSLLTTITATGDSSSTLRIQQHIEGFNVSDLAWGTADARAVTISFWVKSSVAGTYSARITNDAGNRVYMATFAVGSSNAWEYKAVTVPGDTTGTWLTNNGRGITVSYVLAGATAATPNVWGTTGTSATGQTNLCLTNGATFFITGVQLEAGSVATPFERRPYGAELALCQRYYYRLTAQDSFTNFGMGRSYSTTGSQAALALPISMRAKPTGGISSTAHFNQAAPGTISSINPVGNVSGDNRWVMVDIPMTGGTSGSTVALNANNTTAAWMEWSAEL